jgi:hypothetical protein
MMAIPASFALSQLLGAVENHPNLSWKKYTQSDWTAHSGNIVIDSEWRQSVGSPA